MTMSQRKRVVYTVLSSVASRLPPHRGPTKRITISKLLREKFSETTKCTNINKCFNEISLCALQVCFCLAPRFATLDRSGVPRAISVHAQSRFTSGNSDRVAGRTFETYLPCTRTAESY